MPKKTPATTWTSQKVVANDGRANDWLGSWVSISGNTAFVSARNATVNGRAYQGAVYVFKKSGSAWKQTQKLVASDGAAGDQFGAAVALSGRVAVITAPIATVNGNLWQGAAYVFVLVGSKWTQVHKIFARQGSAFETFGNSIACNSTSVFVGAGGAQHIGQRIPRRVYVFEPGTSGAASAWTEKQTIESFIPDDPTSFFGAALAASDTVALIAARGASINGSLGQGSVFVYTKSNGVWTPTAELVAGDGVARDNFGVGLALRGDTALVGAPGAAIDGKIAQGAVYRFDRSGDDWRQTQKLTNDDGAALDLFGASISVANETALVGAYSKNSYRGAAYIFQENSGSWAQVQKLVASDASANSVFGYYTALSDVTALVGSYTANVGANAQQGAAYFFERPLSTAGSEKKLS